MCFHQGNTTVSYRDISEKLGGEAWTVLAKVGHRVRFGGLIRFGSEEFLVNERFIPVGFRVLKLLIFVFGPVVLTEYLNNGCG